MNEYFSQRKGIAFALLAAVLFGLSTPLAKGLTPRVEPVLLAGLLYLGSGIGLGAYALYRSFRGGPAREASLKRTDFPWLTGAIVTGGGLGPLLLMWGLAHTPAASASLLLNLEGVLTALLAWFMFKENFDLRIACGMALIAAGGVLLSWTGWSDIGVPWGSLAIVGACLAWAIDNNLTRKVSASDPVQISMLKGLVAGSVNTVLGLSLGARFPDLADMLAVGAIGFFGYGLSLTLFVLGLRYLGTARTGAYFSIAPFIGAVAAVLLLNERVGAAVVVAAVLMALGLWLHLTERHSHMHEHERLDHDHMHTHDEHHQHAHTADDPPGEPHTHRHPHAPLGHNHPHYPDTHHRHGH